MLCFYSLEGKRRRLQRLRWRLRGKQSALDYMTAIPASAVKSDTLGESAEDVLRFCGTEALIFLKTSFLVVLVGTSAQTTVSSVSTMLSLPFITFIHWT